jgi:superfamily II DNA/RNA helicase
VTTPPPRQTEAQRPRTDALKRIAKALFRNAVAKERVYSERAYQIQTAIEAAMIVHGGRHAAIQLPTGVGKTLIACLIAAFWKHLRPGARTLLIVPSRTLVVQHFEVAKWVAQSLRIDRLTDEQSGNPGSVRRTLLQGELIVSTPGMLANALARGVVGPDVTDTFELVIVDEFDQFVVVEEADRESVARYAQHWGRLVARLPPGARHVVKSATLGLDRSAVRPEARTRSHLRSELISHLLKPAAITVPEHEYAAFVPMQVIIEVCVLDPVIEELLEGTVVAKGIAHQRLDDAVGHVDYRDVERRAPTLCVGLVGRRERIRLASRQYAPITMTREVQRLFGAITRLLMLPQHIREDLTLGLDVMYGPCVIKTAQNEKRYLESAPVLEDMREDHHMHFRAGEKSDAVYRIVESRAAVGQRGVLFVRTVTLLAALKSMLASIDAPLFELTGEKSDEERRIAVQRFRTSANGVLLMTRTTGGRGLDLPFAEYAVFYSPKTEPATMWQEMSRIRSTVSMPKNIYVLCCGVDESATLANVVHELERESRRVVHRQIFIDEIQVVPRQQRRATAARAPQ